MSKKNWWELTKSEKKKMSEILENIWETSHDILFHWVKGSEIDVIHETCFQLISEDVNSLLKELSEKKSTFCLEDEIMDRVFFKTLRYSFAFGYVWGQLFELPELSQDVKKLKGELLRRKALPLLPKEKKAA